MEQPTSQADHMRLWQQRLQAMVANGNDLGHLESGRDKLQGIESRAQLAFRAQAASMAAKQEASKELEILISEGRSVMAYLTAGIRDYYGKDSEKLAEFNITPFRGRRRVVAPPPPTPEDVR